MNLQALELKVPPPVVALFMGIAMWGASRVTPAWQVPALARTWVAVALATIAVVFSVSAVIAFRGARTTVNPTTPQAASSLVSSGVFAISRNPMYVGLLFALTAWAAFLSSAWALPGLPVFAAYIHRFQITPEERALSTLFGPRYSDYKTKVRRWL